MWTGCRSALPCRYATRALPVVPRPCARAPRPSDAWRWRVRLATQYLGMESPCPRTPAGVLREKGRVYPPWSSRYGPLLSHTESALLFTYSWRSSHFSAGIRGPRHYGCCCRVWSFISTRCCYSALSCFDCSRCYIRLAPLIRSDTENQY